MNIVMGLSRRSELRRITTHKKTLLPPRRLARLQRSTRFLRTLSVAEAVGAASTLT